MLSHCTYAHAGRTTRPTVITYPYLLCHSARYPVHVSARVNKHAFCVCIAQRLMLKQGCLAACLLTLLADTRRQRRVSRLYDKSSALQASMKQACAVLLASHRCRVVLHPHDTLEYNKRRRNTERPQLKGEERGGERETCHTCDMWHLRVAGSNTSIPGEL